MREMAYLIDIESYRPTKKGTARFLRQILRLNRVLLVRLLRIYHLRCQFLNQPDKAHALHLSMLQSGTRQLLPHPSQRGKGLHF